MVEVVLTILGVPHFDSGSTIYLLSTSTVLVLVQEAANTYQCKIQQLIDDTHLLNFSSCGIPDP